MKDEIKEIKIGMYTTDEILEFMTNGEGRGFMGRSMYDAILDYITNLQEENERLNNIINELEKWLNENWNKPLAKIYVADVVKKISELKENK